VQVGVRRAAPWTVSAAVHLALLLLGFAVTWSIIEHEERLPSPVVTPDLAVVTPLLPLRALPRAEAKAAEMPPVPDAPAARGDEAPIRIEGPVSVASVLSPPSLAFAGAGLETAREVVFVIDASGSMIAWLPFVIDEVERTLSQMRGEQWFAVVCFAGDNIYVTPRSGLTAVAEESARSVVEDLRGTTNDLVGGGSDPTLALREALAMRPELIMLLSEGLDGRGRFAVNRAEVLSTLDKINPRGPGGSRQARIACIRLLTGDDVAPARLMQAIVDAHGDGEITTVSLEELDQ